MTPWTAAHQVPCHHQLLEAAQTHVHRVSGAIQPSHPLSSPSPPSKCKMTTKTPAKPCPSYTASSMLLPERTLFKNDSETVIRLFLQLGLLIMAIILYIRTAHLLIGLTPALHPFNVFSISSKIFQALSLPG